MTHTSNVLMRVEGDKRAQERGEKRRRKKMRKGKKNTIRKSKSESNDGDVVLPLTPEPHPAFPQLPPLPVFLHLEFYAAMGLVCGIVGWHCALRG